VPASPTPTSRSATPTSGHIRCIEPPVLTKIVATIGPASEDEATLRRLILAGASIFRLNFSHGTPDEHADRLRTIRRVSSELRTCVGVLGDLPGPKIRVGAVPDISPDDSSGGGGARGILLTVGQEVLLSRDAHEAGLADGPGSTAVLPMTYGDLVDEVQPGQRVLINDGAIRMLAIGREPDANAMRCCVTGGGRVTSGKGINLPETDVRAPALTDRDRELAGWAVEHEVDYLALSFVRSAGEIEELRDLLASGGGGGTSMPIIAKIEKPQALRAIEEIAQAADGIMVARGDLGVEMDIPEVPPAQKRIIRAAGRWGKPCIVATQMLETMIDSAIPTRAEASDVANAIFDRAGAVMLSGETAVGRHPTLVVDTMTRIARAAEASDDAGHDEPSPPARAKQTRYRTAALAHGAWHLARDLGVRAIACWSQHGGTARYLSQNNFATPIIAWSSDPATTRRMALLRGVYPVLADPPPNGRLADWTDMVEEHLVGHGWAAEGDQVVLIAGRPLGTPKAVNSLSVLEIGDPGGGYRTHA